MRRPDLDGAAADEAARLVAAHLRRARRRAKAWRRAPDDREALHALRTALRRLRALLRAFRPVLGDIARGAIRRRLRLAAGTTSALRDLDVFADWVAVQPAVPQGRRLLRRIRKATSDELAAVGPAFDAAWTGADRRMRRALQAHASAATAPAHAGVGARGGRRFEGALRTAVQRECLALRAGLPALDPVRRPDEVHGLRIAAKRLRHVLDAAAPRTMVVRRSIAWCRAWQDRVGAWRDAHVATAMLRRWRDEPAVLALRRAHRRRLRESRVALETFAADRHAWRDALDVRWSRA